MGGFRLEDRNGAPLPLNLRKAEALLAYLAVSPGQTAARETLAALLWGGFEQPRARQSLRQVLLALGKTLNAGRPPVLHVSSQTVALGPGALLVDVQQLTRLATEGSAQSLAAAAALYRGEFLAGLRLDAPEFEDWLSMMRDKLRDLVTKVLIELLGHQEEADQVGAATATARQILALDPFREDVHRRLMRLYLCHGMRSSALLQYRECREALARELGIAPDEETTRLYRRILDQGGEPAGRDARPQPRTTAPAQQPSAGAAERQRAEILESHYRALAGRLGETGRGEQALESLLHAGRLEMNRGSPLTARRLLAQADSALEVPEGRADGARLVLDLHLVRAAAAEAVGDLGDARSALDAAEPLTGTSANPGRRAQVLIARSRIHWRHGEEEAGWDHARRGLALVERAGGMGVWLATERFLARRHLIAGPVRALAERLDRRARRCAELGLSAEEAEVSALLGLARATAGDFVGAQGDCARAAALAEDTRLPDCLLVALEAQGLVRLWRAEAGPALESFTRAREIAEGRGDLLRRYTLGGFLGLALMAGGRWAAARRELDRAVALAGRLETRFLLPFLKAWQAEAGCRSTVGAEASGFSREVQSLAARANQPWAGSIASRALAVALSRPCSRDLGRAERAINAAVATQRGLDLRFELARSLMVQAEILDARGKTAQSGAAVAEADALFRQMSQAPRSRGVEAPEERGPAS
jgi:DNA-binding SARP family transcriptional activator